MNIVDRQTLIFSVNLNTLSTSQINAAVNLRFAANELIFKHLSYTPGIINNDHADVVQIWCNITNDGLLTSFANNTQVNSYHNDYFHLNNNFQIGTINFQFQQSGDSTAPIYTNPQPLISDFVGGSNTNGILSFTIEFIKLEK